MIDINNSQDYDPASFQEFAEERRHAGSYGGLLGQLTLVLEAKMEPTDPVAFMKTHYPHRSLFRFILTHPDLDHMRGLKRLHNEIGFTNFWDVAHTKECPTFRSDADREDWQFYQSTRRGTHGHTVMTCHRGDQRFAFAADEHGNLGGDGIEVLSPTPQLIASCNAACKSNDLSYVLRITHAGQNVLLTGDIEQEAWDDLVSAYGNGLRSSVLAASHHGRDSGYHLGALRHIAPDVILVSVGRAPATDATNKYCAHCASVKSTRRHGNIQLNIHDDGRREWFVDRNWDLP